jgi:hypothetical protein
LEDNVWLASRRIMAALLNTKQQYPSNGDLFDTLLLHDEIKPSKTIVVLHVYNHSVAVTNVNLSRGCYSVDVHVYDSLGNVSYFDKG